MGRKSFYDELHKLYDVEEFTGHLGVLLSSARDDGSSAYDKGYEQDKAVESALDFLQSIYDIAVKNL